MGTDAVAPARMPYELSSAGFNVTLLAPRDALATHTAFVDKIGYFPPDGRSINGCKRLPVPCAPCGPR